MRRRILVSLVLLISFIYPISPAKAAWIQYQSSEADTYNRSDLTAAFDITRLDFGISDKAPDEYWFFLNFAQPVSANQFNDGAASWAGILLDLNNDGKEDYSLQTSQSNNYSENYSHSGRFVDRTSASPFTSSDCKVETWTNLTTKASWIGFSIKKSCKTFSSTIGIRGYSDRVSNDDKDFDFAPDAYWKANISGGAVTPSGNSTSTTIAGQLPIVDNCVFSIMGPNSTIPTHDGHPGDHLRVHLGINTDGQAWIRVGQDRRHWHTGEVIIFDDRLDHETANPSDQPRVVLLFDIVSKDYND